MSGFSAEWLALREEADRRARNPDLLERVAALLRACAHPRIVDLGCGTGSNLRAMAPALGPRQDWHLVDHDAGLLVAARDALSAWADAARSAGDRLSLEKDGRMITVVFTCADLAHDVEGALSEGCDLVTAAALIDLASESWLQRLGLRLARSGTPFYTVLAYNGAETWSPPHVLDAEMLAAFHRHQERDKGFGPAAGPRAAGILAGVLAAADYAVMQTASDWVLGGADAPLVRALVEGIAQAVEETGLVPTASVRAWRVARHAGAACRVGHTDLLASPVRGAGVSASAAGVSAASAT